MMEDGESNSGADDSIDEAAALQSGGKRRHCKRRHCKRRHRDRHRNRHRGIATRSRLTMAIDDVAMRMATDGGATDCRTSGIKQGALECTCDGAK